MARGVSVVGSVGSIAADEPLGGAGGSRPTAGVGGNVGREALKPYKPRDDAEAQRKIDEESAKKAEEPIGAGATAGVSVEDVGGGNPGGGSSPSGGEGAPGGDAGPGPGDSGAPDGPDATGAW